jgi:hypothetical protein
VSAGKHQISALVRVTLSVHPARMRRSQAVSYTHLDAAKRLELRCISVFERAKITRANWIIEISLADTRAKSMSKRLHI